MQLSIADFQSALAGLLLDVPLRVAPARLPLYAGRRLALASQQFAEEPWQSELARAYGQMCEQRGTPGDCLTLFDDGPHLRADDKRGIALAFAVEPALEGLNAEVRAMLSPAQMLATVSIAAGVWLALMVAPEPLSKGVAAAATVLLWGYLGWELFDLLRAYVRLAEEAGQAHTLAELRAAGVRFGRVIGPNSLRILVMVSTAAVGETAALLSRARKLPGFGKAMDNAERAGGLHLVDMAAGAERVMVSVPEGTIRVVAPPNALLTATRGTRSAGPASKGGRLLANGHRAFKSFDDFKDFMGAAGKDKQWHHIVEQRKSNLQRFGPEALHNTENVIAVDVNIHKEISRLYSSKSDELGGMVVREWLRTQSYEQQRAFGLKVLRQFGVLP